jgi:glyoxylase-like metal-dependent hydrolase (beta-lactamase superfamily II)
MIFRQLIDKETSTYTYILGDADSGVALIIDPVIDQVERDIKILAELGLTLTHTLDTHVHADHITGSGVLRERLGAKTVVSTRAKVKCADIDAQQGQTIAFGAHSLEIRLTPGHTSSCMSFVVVNGDTTMVFSGDALFVRGCGRTDFQQGSPSDLYDSVHNEIYSLPDDTLVYPGHDYKGHTVTTVAEEKAHNPRLNLGIDKAGFSAIMDGLKLGYPKKIKESLPANMACGEIKPKTEGMEA